MLVEAVDAAVVERARQTRFHLDVGELGVPCRKATMLGDLSLVEGSIPEPVDGVCHVTQLRERRF